MAWWFLSGLAGSVILACIMTFSGRGVSRGDVVKLLALLAIGPICALLALLCILVYFVEWLNSIASSSFWSKRLW